MKKKKIPKEYFTKEEFLFDEEIESALGVLGPNPSPEQFIKFELCRIIGQMIKNKKMDLLEVEKLTGINSSDISRIKNHHIDRFTIDRLLKIYLVLDNKNGLGQFLRNVSEKIDKLSA